jgi:hypothetical protein
MENDTKDKKMKKKHDMTVSNSATSILGQL